MANPWRGEVELVVDGEPRVMRLTLAALAELEARLKSESLVELIGRFEAGGFRVRDLIALLDRRPERRRLADQRGGAGQGRDRRRAAGGGAGGGAAPEAHLHACPTRTGGGMTRIAWPELMRARAGAAAADAGGLLGPDAGGADADGRAGLRARGADAGGPRRARRALSRRARGERAEPE